MLGLRIVIADDEALIRLHVRQTLESLGHVVVGEAADGQRAVALARALRPDVVIVDLEMARFDGLETVRVLRQERIAAAIVLTAHATARWRDEASAAGAVAYLVKPFHEAQLLAALLQAHSYPQELRSVDGLSGQLQPVRTHLHATDASEGGGQGGQPCYPC